MLAATRRGPRRRTDRRRKRQGTPSTDGPSLAASAVSAALRPSDPRDQSRMLAADTDQLTGPRPPIFASNASRKREPLEWARAVLR